MDKINSRIPLNSVDDTANLYIRLTIDQAIGNGATGLTLSLAKNNLGNVFALTKLHIKPEAMNSEFKECAEKDMDELGRYIIQFNAVRISDFMTILRVFNDKSWWPNSFIFERDKKGYLISALVLTPDTYDELIEPKKSLEDILKKVEDVDILVGNFSKDRKRGFWRQARPADQWIQLIESSISCLKVDLKACLAGETIDCTVPEGQTIHFIHLEIEPVVAD